MMDFSAEKKMYLICYMLRSACILYGSTCRSNCCTHTYLAHVAELEAGYLAKTGCIHQFGKVRKYILGFKTKDEIESYSRVSLRLSVDSRP